MKDPIRIIKSQDRDDWIHWKDGINEEHKEMVDIKTWQVVDIKDILTNRKLIPKKTVIQIKAQ